jgi:RNA polymerase sigma-70 factor (ECF subfamily)
LAERCLAGFAGELTVETGQQAGDHRHPGERYRQGRRGQVDDFSKLLEQQIPRLRRYAFALHRSSKSRADDLVQDTLVRAVAKQHLWKPGTNLLGWLITLMHNQNVNDVRRSVVREGFGHAVGKFHDTLASVNDTSSSLQLRDLERAMARLPLDHREIILLVALEGMSYEADAKLFDIPIGTVRSRLSRSRAALRQMMDTGEWTAPASRARQDLAASATA